MEQNTLEPPVRNSSMQKFRNLLKNKTVVFGLIMILVFIILLITIFLSHAVEQNVTNGNNTGGTTKDVTATQQEMSPTQSEENQQIITTIKTQVKPQLSKRIQIPYTISKVKTYGDSWALLQVTSPSTDPANIVLEKVEDAWVVKDGPGTMFDPTSLKQIGAPQDLINDANSRL